MGTLDLFKLEDRGAVVAGAGRGLGRAMAHGLAKAGAYPEIETRPSLEPGPGFFVRQYSD